MNKYHRKTVAFCMAIVFMGTIFAGCGRNQERDEFVPIVREPYEKKVFESVKVEKGTIYPTLEMSLCPDEYEVNSYGIKKDMLVVSKLNVEEGSHVNAGDVMVLFENEEVSDELEVYKEQREETRILIEHFENLLKIDSEGGYQNDIDGLRGDLAVLDANIKETEAKLSDYQIVAKKAGVVTSINKNLFKGYGEKNDTLIQVTSGSSNYVATTGDPYEFEVGKEYEVANGVASYQLKLISLDEKEGVKTLTFSPVSDMSGLKESGNLTMVIQKEPIENTLYVDNKAVVQVDDRFYLYQLDDKGYRHPLEVKISDVIDGKAIITSGINEGEWVTVE